MIEYKILKVIKTKDSEEIESVIDLSFLQYNLLLAMVKKWIGRPGGYIIPMVQAEIIEDKLKELL